MAEKQILLFPAPAVAPLPTADPRPIPSPSRPTAGQQKARLDNRFKEIVDSFGQIETTVERADSHQVIVLEAIDSVEDVAKAAGKIPGMEWLSEIDLEDVEPSFGFEHSDEKSKQKPLSQRLYAIMTNQAGIAKLLSLWNSWTSTPNKQAARGFGPFKQLFQNLRDIRRWNHHDRLTETGMLDDWKLDLEFLSGDLRFEIELWHREEVSARQQAATAVRAILSGIEGAVVHEAALPEIRYHGMLVTVPAQHIQMAVDSLTTENPVELIRCHDVMFFRPHGQAIFKSGRSESEVTHEEPIAELPTSEPVVALLDGLPLENHKLLAGRMRIDDPDDLSAQYESQFQQHGTTMASLILHGDLAAEGRPIKSSIYVRPILQPDPQPLADGVEVTARDRLLVDLLHQAVRRIKAGDGIEPPSAPSVRIINLSIGIPSQPFLRSMSPLARLLDWLAWKYQVLFVVSAGNHLSPIVLDATNSEWDNFTTEERRKAVMEAIRAQQPHRQPLAPAECLNGITVGSSHNDASQRLQADRRIDVYSGQSLPSPLNPVASGFRRSVTPDVLLPGGRLVFDRIPSSGSDPVKLRPSRAQSPPGNRVAVPGTQALELNRLEHTRGTSNAAALTSRLGARIHERLIQLRNEPNGDQLTDDCMPVLIKTLLVHGASWDDASRILDSVFRQTLRDETNNPRKAAAQLKKLKSAFLGFGVVSEDKSLFCTNERYTFLGCDAITDKIGHTYRFPLPGPLAGQNVKRRMTYTLAWMSPVNFRHNRYRIAKLKVEWPDNDPLRLDVADVSKADSLRGTVEHHVREGKRNVTFGDDETLEIRVTCKSDAGTLTETILYGLAVSLEIAEPLQESIYEAVNVRPRVEISDV